MKNNCFLSELRPSGAAVLLPDYDGDFHTPAESWSCCVVVRYQHEMKLPTPRLCQCARRGPARAGEAKRLTCHAHRSLETLAQAWASGQSSQAKEQGRAKRARATVASRKPSGHAPHVHEAILRFLDDGFSQHKTARLLKVSQATVWRVAKARECGASKFERYEAGKAEIAATSRSSHEYEMRIRELAERIGI